MKEMEFQIPKEICEDFIREAAEWKIQEIKKAKSTAKLEVELPAEVVDFLKRFCEWAGYDVSYYVKMALILDMESVLDSVRGETIPKGNELWDEIQELKRKMLGGQ